MALFYFNNNAIIGQSYEAATSFATANFTATSRISETDFRNQSLTTITVPDANQQLLDYLTSSQGRTFPGGPPSGGVAPLYLIVHPTTIITPTSTTHTYDYDGCRFQCYSSSNNSGHLMGFRSNTQTYDFQPTFSYVYAAPAELGSQNIPVTRISYVRWVAWWDSVNNRVGALRPLYAINMNGTGWVGGNGNAYFYGPLVPSSTVNEWFSNIIQRVDPDAPPAPDPGDSDSQDATSTGFTWLNQFEIMNWGASDPWPQKMLFDIPSGGINQYYYNGNDHWQEYLAQGDGLTDGGQFPWWGANKYTIKAYGVYQNLSAIHTFGSNLGTYDKVSANEGKFIKYTDEDGQGDTITGTKTEFGTPVNDIMISNNFLLHFTWPNDYVRGITITNNGSTFNSETNYPNYNYHNKIGKLLIPTTSMYATFPLLCIIRRGGHYYLGGLCFLYDGSTFHCGLGVACRIDKLKDMPGYGGSDPDDPDNVTGTDPDSPGIDPTKTFGDGTGIGPSPTTDDGIGNNTGDGTGPIDPGLGGPNGNGGLGSPGYYDPDGTYHAPDGTTYGPDDPNNPRNKGTGEKQSNPVNTATTTNIHDGSVGNGTADPHGKDTAVTDPGTTLPAAGTTGTIGGGGFLSIFTPTQAELDNFANELLNTTTLNAIKQYFSSNPMDGIFGLHILPYSGFAGSTVANPKIGSYDFSTTVTLAGEEYLNIDYGSMYVDFVYDGYENFAPQSDAKIFLPFIGTKDIDINLIQGCNISLKYNVSLVTGDIYAYLYAQWAGKYQQAGTLQGVDHLLYHWQGNCAVNIPLSHVDSSNYISGAMQIAGGITSLAAGAIAGSPFTIPSAITGVTQGIAEMGRSSIITSGNISGVAAFMGSREPYLILSRPIIAFDSQYNHYLGRKSNAIARIAALQEGSYTIMRNVDLSGIVATNDEKQMIEGFLKGGFYV